MSIYIPHVFMNIGEDRITKVFDKLRLGKVKHVDFVLKLNGKSSAYVHFEYWYDNAASKHFRERVRDPEKEARVVYDEPWYWTVLENTSEKKIRQKKTQRRMYIDLSGFNTPPSYESSSTYDINDNNNDNDNDNNIIKKTYFKDRLLQKNTTISCNYDYEAWAINNKSLVNSHNNNSDMESILQEDYNDLVTIDGIYVKTLEDENASLRKALEDKTKEAERYLYESEELIQEKTHRENMLQDKAECLDLEISILKDKLAKSALEYKQAYGVDLTSY